VVIKFSLPSHIELITTKIFIMLRRDLLKKVTIVLGGIALSPEMIARALGQREAVLEQVPASRLDLLAELSDTILPDTDTPGAKAAKVHDYIAIIVDACFPPERSQQFWSDLEVADAVCTKVHGQSFVACNPSQRVAFLTDLEAKATNDPSDFWLTLKDLTLHGYFTSEIGATQALNYDPIPGGWIPDMVIDENTKAWTPVF
jgi:Gluconate 2-dehydrogenase subunit 3